MFPESLGWRTLTGQPNDPPPPMYDPFASLIADYLPGSDIDRGGLEGTVRFRHASRVRATFFRVPSLLSPPLLCLPFLVHCRDTHRESSYTRRRGI